jgi:hypothetical protein
MKNRHLPILRLALLGLVSLSFFAPITAANQTDLARVAILEFNDNTGQPSFGWVKKSLPDGIYSSMKEHFDFVRADASVAEQRADKILGYAHEYSVEMIDQIARENKFDIVIYGDYKYNKQTGKMEIAANVYHLEGKKIIGSVREQSELNNQVFNQIDIISKKIVDHIYGFALALNAEDARKKREEDVRLLVLVPSWSNDAEKQTAIAELEIQKKELKKKYQAEFITIFEFFRKKKTSYAEQRKVEDMAKARNDTAIVAWLTTQKVPNALIVLVNGNKVDLRPVVDGRSRQTVSYALNASAAEKAKAINGVVVESGMNENLEKTKISKAGLYDGRFSLAAGVFGVKTIFSGSDQINSGVGLELQGLFRLWTMGNIQVGAAGLLQGYSQKHDLANGDGDFYLSVYTALIGPDFILPLPMYRKLEFHLMLLGGAAYSILEKYKYIDTTLNFKSVNPAIAAQLEVRWQFWRGVFVGVAGGYQQILYSGTDMQNVSATARAGYRF